MHLVFLTDLKRELRSLADLCCRYWTYWPLCIHFRTISSYFIQNVI